METSALPARKSFSNPWKREEHRRCRLRSGRRPLESSGIPAVLRVVNSLSPIHTKRRMRGRNVDAFFRNARSFLLRPPASGPDCWKRCAGQAKKTETSGQAILPRHPDSLRSQRQPGNSPATRSMSPCSAAPRRVGSISKNPLKKTRPSDRCFMMDKFRTVARS
jgi:hypothetical protein